MHYKGSATYQTRLGALISLITQALIIINLISLSVDFFDYSRQEEKIQTTKIDRFFGEAYTFSNYNMTLSLLTTQEFDDSIGKIKLVRNRDCKISGEDPASVKASY